MVFENLLDPVFSPLLSLDSWLAILIISFLITIITTLAYKYLTDQKRMKELKAELKKYQEKIKKLKSEPEKAMKVQKEMMGKNMEMMKHSFKPMLYTLIPLLIIFGWLNAHMAYEPLYPDTPFLIDVGFDKGTAGDVTFSSIPELQVHKDDNATQKIVDDKTSWTLRGASGEYQLLFDYEGIKVIKDIIISDQAGEYTNPLENPKEDPFKSITIGNKKIRPLKGVPIIGNLSWLWVYIIFSMAISIGMRKALKIA